MGNDGTRLYVDNTTKFVSNGCEVVGMVNMHGDIAMNDGTICTINHFGDLVDSNGNVRGSARDGKLIYYSQSEAKEGLSSPGLLDYFLNLPLKTKAKLVAVSAIFLTLYIVVLVVFAIISGSNPLFTIGLGIAFVLIGVGPVVASALILYWFLVIRKK